MTDGRIGQAFHPSYVLAVAPFRKDSYAVSDFVENAEVIKTQGITPANAAVT